MPFAESVSVVVPVFNSEPILEELTERLERSLRGAAAYELVFVDDCSPDRSWLKLEELRAGRPCLRALPLVRNVGQQRATLYGIRAARHGVIVTLDDDLQHPPEEIPKLLTKLEEGFDLVYGRPREEKRGLWRRAAARSVKWSVRLASGSRAARYTGPFRAFRAGLKRGFPAVDRPDAFVDALLAKQTRAVAAVEVVHAHRAAGRSNYSFPMLVEHAWRMAKGFRA